MQSLPALVRRRDASHRQNHRGSPGGPVTPVTGVASGGPARQERRGALRPGHGGSARLHQSWSIEGGHTFRSTREKLKRSEPCLWAEFRPWLERSRVLKGSTSPTSTVTRWFTDDRHRRTRSPTFSPCGGLLPIA